MKFWPVLFLVLSFAAQATRLRSGVMEVQSGPKVMVKLTSGEVLWANPADGALVAALNAAQAKKVIAEFDFNRDSHALSAVALTSEKAELPSFAQDKDDDEEPVYQFSVFSSYSILKATHDSLDNRTFDDSQCYNRAHGWAYQMWRNQGVYSMKIFIFFTDRYIREYQHKWWFHVAPMTYLREAYGVNEYVMDRSFSDQPVYPQVWTNIFMKNQAVCRSVDRWGDYRKNDPNEYCYLMRASMYYWNTVSLKNRDTSGLFRGRRFMSDWNLNEVREAYSQGFIFAQDHDI